MTDVALAVDQQQRVWTRALVSLGLVLTGLVLIFWSTAASMVTIWWRSETFTHAFIVPPMVFWLAWRRRAQLLPMSPSPSYWVLLPMALVALGWLLGQLVVVNAVTQFGLVAMMVLAVPAVLGTDIARALTFPLCFAFFAVPFGEFALPMLMQWTADFTVGALRLSGVPVYREGLRFVIPTGYWSVVEACSGVRYLIASFMVGSLYAYLNYQSSKRRWIFVGLSLAVPILANWVRAYLIVMLGHLSNNQIATGVDHLVYGWIFFGIVIMALFMIGARWAEPEDLGAANPVAASLGSKPGSAGMTAMPVAVLALLVTALPSLAWMKLAHDPANTNAGAVPLSWPAGALPNWRAAGPVDPSFEPAFQNPAAKADQAYESAQQARVGLHVFYYRDERDGSKVISSNNVLVKADDYRWNAISATTRHLTNQEVGIDLTVRESLLLAADQPGVTRRERLKVWLWFWIDGKWTSSDFEAKLRGAWARLNGRNGGGAAIVLHASEKQVGGAEAAMRTFLHDHRAAIEARLLAARDGTP